MTMSEVRHMGLCTDLLSIQGLQLTAKIQRG